MLLYTRVSDMNNACRKSTNANSHNEELIKYEPELLEISILNFHLMLWKFFSVTYIKFKILSS